jgi:hypothetical protein
MTLVFRCRQLGREVLPCTNPLDRRRPVDFLPSDPLTGGRRSVQPVVKNPADKNKEANGLLGDTNPTFLFQSSTTYNSETRGRIHCNAGE